ncbi:hypothetical protein [Micromonospora sp. NPDC005413]|uniref:hypothetical protein n=1 Tax=Micromonospora sp. NPDC005413 TaxID=3154563 RepID=UPI0033AE1B02
MSLRTRQSPRTRWTLALVAGSAALLMVAGCGSDDEGGSSDPDQASAGAPEGVSAYLGCLRDQGIDISNTLPSGRPSGFPSGGPGGGRMDGFRPQGVDDATWQKAQDACASLRPTGGPGGNGPGGPGGGNREASAAYRNCLSDRGVDLQANPATTDPKVAAAMQACEVLRPTATATP